MASSRNGGNDQCSPQQHLTRAASHKRTHGSSADVA
jgi:hypothetical protein